MTRLLASRFVRRVAVLAGGSVAGRAIVILATPVLTRLYTPDDFGVLAVYMALLGIFGGITCLRYELAIPLPASDRVAANLLVLSLGLAAVSGLLVTLVVWVAAAPLAAWLDVPALRPYFWLLPLGLLGIGAYQALNFWSIRKRAFRRLAWTLVAQGIGQVGVQLGLILVMAGPLGLLLGAWVGQTAGVSSLAAAAWQKERAAFRTIRLRNLRRVMRRYRRFPIYATGAYLLYSSGQQLLPLLLAALHGLEVAGWYALALRVVVMPLTLLGGNVAQVYVGEAAYLLRHDPRALGRLCQRILLVLATIAAVVLGPLALVAPALFGLVFGPGWAEAGLIVQLLIPAFFGQILVSSIASTLDIMERPEITALVNATQLTVILSVFALSHWMDWSAQMMIGIYSICMFVIYISQVFLILWFIASAREEATA